MMQDCTHLMMDLSFPCTCKVLFLAKAKELNFAFLRIKYATQRGGTDSKCFLKRKLIAVNKMETFLYENVKIFLKFRT